MKYTITYVSGAPIQHRPGLTNVIVNSNGIKIFKQIIRLDQINDCQIDYEVKDSDLSAGKALAGAVIAGGVGAVVGGMMGGSRVKVTLKIDYIIFERQEQMILVGNQAEQIKKALDKRMAKVKPTQSLSARKDENQKSVFMKFLYWYFAIYRYGYRFIKKMLRIRKT